MKLRTQRKASTWAHDRRLLDRLDLHVQDSFGIVLYLSTFVLYLRGVSCAWMLQSRLITCSIRAIFNFLPFRSAALQVMKARTFQSSNTQPISWTADQEDWRYHRRIRQSKHKVSSHISRCAATACGARASLRGGQTNYYYYLLYKIQNATTMPRMTAAGSTATCRWTQCRLQSFHNTSEDK